ncbi:hypothetical protein GQ457_11G025270 [Hibiscus cannabinus]
MNEWSDQDKKNIQLNSKVMHILFCELGPDEYGSVSSYENAKNVWGKLEVTHDGTYVVKEKRLVFST